MKRSRLLPLVAGFWLVSSCRALAIPEPSMRALTATLQAARPVTSAMTATSKPRPTATVAPTATPDVVATITAASEPRLCSSLLSPDGEWRAEVLIHDCVTVGGADEMAYEQLKLIRTSNSVESVADTQLLYCRGLGAFGLAGLFWSPNSRYFYYTNAREGVPDGCGYWERPIIRLDVTNLRLEYLGGGRRSPDGTRLATWQGKELVIWDTDGGEIGRVPAMALDAETGPIAWSPDSQALVYVQFASYCLLSGKSRVVRLDLSPLRQTLLLESEAPTFGGAAWDTPNELTLFDEGGKRWRYNLATQQLRETP